VGGIGEATIWAGLGYFALTVLVTVGGGAIFAALIRFTGKERWRRGQSYDAKFVPGAGTSPGAGTPPAAARFEIPKPVVADDPVAEAQAAANHFPHPVALVTDDQLIVEQGPARRAAVPLRYIVSLAAGGRVGLWTFVRNRQETAYYLGPGTSTITINLSQPVQVLRNRPMTVRSLTVQVTDPKGLLGALASATQLVPDDAALGPALDQAAVAEARNAAWWRLVDDAFVPSLLLAIPLAVACVLFTKPWAAVFAFAMLGWLPMTLVVIQQIGLRLRRRPRASMPPVLRVWVGLVGGLFALVAVYAEAKYSRGVFDAIGVVLAGASLSFWVVGGVMYAKGFERCFARIRRARAAARRAST
jgi:hypothetical protein